MSDESSDKNFKIAYLYMKNSSFALFVREGFSSNLRSFVAVLVLQINHLKITWRSKLKDNFSSTISKPLMSIKFHDS